MSNLFQSSFVNKNVLVTGHTGFKGSWLIAWLKKLGANVTGVSLDPVTKPNHFEVLDLSEDITDLRFDIRDVDKINNTVDQVKPDFVFHLAAQALVRKSYEEPLDTWEVNVMGTLNVLEALRKLKNPCAAVIITSDKCYDNVEWVWGYRETDAIGGPDPYSASKGAAELAIRSHIKSYFPEESSQVRIASARAGNVIGGGDWSLDRIIPDCVKAWSDNQEVELRSPNATRPWQHVLEPLSGYLTLAVALTKTGSIHGEPFNFGPSAKQNHSVIQLVEQMSHYWEQVRYRDVSDKEFGPYESGLLKLNCDKALHYLNWRSVMDFEDTVRMTSNWYSSYYSSPESISSVTSSQIDEYMRMAEKLQIEWSL